MQQSSTNMLKIQMLRRLTREYILSDEGQENLAKGYARPIRENVQLSEEVKSLLLPEEIYENAKPVRIKKHGKKQQNKFHNCGRRRY